jgi:hypothetical protein
MPISNATPSNVDGFSRYFAERFNEPDIIGTTTGFLSVFSRRSPVIRTDANVVDIDITRGNEKTSVYIPRGVVGEYLFRSNTGKGKYTNLQRTFPLAEDEWDLTVEQVETRMAGENPYAMRSRFERMRDRAADAYSSMVARMVRLWERTAATVVLTGKQPTILGTSDDNLIIDYLRNSSLTHDYATGKWSTADVDVIGDIDTRIDTLNAIGHVAGQAGGDYVIVMGATTLKGFFGNNTVVAAGDSRRIITIEKNPNMVVPSQISDMIAGGMTYIAFLSTTKGRRVHILYYDAYYDTDAGVSTPYMTADSYVIMPISFRADRYFGPPDTLPMTSIDNAYLRETFGITPGSPVMPMNLKAKAGVVFPQAFYTDAYPGNGRKSAVLRVQSAPIFAPTQTDAFFVGTSVAV